MLEHGLGDGAEGHLVEPVAAACPRHDELGVGRVRYFGPRYVHQVRNVGTEAAVSVHVYAPRLSVMNTYRVEHGRLERIGTEKAGVDW